ncbi:uncharacterized protein B0I36DRAFT_52134 [Microdochium trichocladiopsis]|uniref:Uncharacterized protein n=1 Tax=Microdochium trichocladiopsis TaxID=1682393 RepID=A0A9P9BHZ2_9PEZI|nr:uncharacterized protein B0I36DRAFT_52134 [Microdochium trichocladiopsis]KAH7012580.1 hypothetical protein B0I36DRAFT_52134 [Microdochium trichocladiopsis]
MTAGPHYKRGVQALRKPGEDAVVCIDGYLSTDFGGEGENHHRRYAVSARKIVPVLAAFCVGFYSWHMSSLFVDAHPNLGTILHHTLVLMCSVSIEILQNPFIAHHLPSFLLFELTNIPHNLYRITQSVAGPDYWLRALRSQAVMRQRTALSVSIRQALRKR